MVISIIIITIIITTTTTTQKDLQQCDSHLKVRMTLFFLPLISNFSIMDKISFGIKEKAIEGELKQWKNLKIFVFLNVWFILKQETR